MLVHDMDSQELARQQMMEGSGNLRAHGGNQVVRLMADSQPPVRPLLQGNIISNRNWVCPSLHNGGVRMINGVGLVKKTNERDDLSQSNHTMCSTAH